MPDCRSHASSEKYTVVFQIVGFRYAFVSFHVLLFQVFIGFGIDMLILFCLGGTTWVVRFP